MNSGHSSARTATIAAEHAGRRIDNFLLSTLRGTPRSLIYKLLRSGQVRVNGGRVKPDYRLAEADRVRIPPVREHEAGDVHIPARRIAELESALLLEDEHFIVVSKPAGLACHAGTGLRYGVVEIARHMRPGADRIDLAHRIDRDTSGCLVLSKTVTALRAFHDAQRAGAITKQYLALLRGRLDPGLRVIDAALGTARDDRGERHVDFDDDGKPSVTAIEDCDAAGDHSLALLRLETGRMHQIRAHAAHIGHPVAGDRRYGDPGFNRAMRALGLERLFLHAQVIAFEAAGRTYEARAALPTELSTVSDRLRGIR